MTGVQTCALPILFPPPFVSSSAFCRVKKLKVENCVWDVSSSEAYGSVGGQAGYAFPPGGAPFAPSALVFPPAPPGSRGQVAVRAADSTGSLPRGASRRVAAGDHRDLHRRDTLSYTTLFRSPLICLSTRYEDSPVTNQIFTG